MDVNAINREAEDFMLSAWEQVLFKAKQAELSVETYSDDKLLECCRSMLILERSATNNLEKANYESSLLHYWRFLLIYRNNIHQIRRSRMLKISLKSRLEEKATSSVAAVEWLRLKHYQRHTLNRLRYKRDCQLRRKVQNNSYAQILHKAESTLRKFKSIYQSMISRSFTGRVLPPQGFEAGYKLLSMLKEEGRKQKLSMPCTVSSTIRSVYLPTQTMDSFRPALYTNDFKKIKTTGLLAATSKDGVLVVSHLLIPEQRADSDSCTTLQTLHLQQFIISNQLFIIGYIFSAVKGDADLSWLECHQLCTLRQKVQEAFAVVICNFKEKIRYFYLTVAGFDLISNCKETDVHTHNMEQPKYKEPPHVNQTDLYSIIVKDFRNDDGHTQFLSNMTSYQLFKAQQTELK